MAAPHDRRGCDERARHASPLRGTRHAATATTSHEACRRTGACQRASSKRPKARGKEEETSERRRAAVTSERGSRESAEGERSRGSSGG